MYCANCGKSISEETNFCPDCGFALKVISNAGQSNQEELKCPVFPSDLSIGKGLVNWGGDTIIQGEYHHNKNVVKEIPEGSIKLLLYQKGIKIISGSISQLNVSISAIHFSQIISMKETTENELVQIDKSVIGRAVVGGVLFGPFGAIIGGMSGIGSKTKTKNNHLLILSYWDIEKKQPMSIIITTGVLVAPFIRRYEKELKK